MTTKPIQSSFMMGELSPRLWCAAHLPGYAYGARTLENWMVINPGVFTHRPGFRYVAKAGATSSGENNAVLVPFVYSVDDSYMLEFGPLYIHLYRNKAKITSGGSVVSVTTTYTADELGALQFYQSADVMFITHPNHAPAKLVRTSHTSWTISDCSIESGPFLTQNTDESLTITPSAISGNGITLTASSALFESTHANALWAIRHVMPEAVQSGTITGTINNAALVLPKDGEWNLNLTDVSSSSDITLQIQISLDGGVTWSVASEYVNDTTLTIDRSASGGNTAGQYAQVRLSCTSYTSGSVTYELRVPAYVHQGIVRIDTPEADGLTTTADVLTNLGALDATYRHSEGAWSEKRGFPSCIGFSGDRVLYGSTTHQPNTIWASVVGEYENLLTGTTESDAYSFTLSRPQQNPILWIVGHLNDSIYLGTTGGIIQLIPVSTGAFSYSNPPKVYSSDATPASANVPVLAANVLVCIDGTQKKLHQIVYNDQEASIMAQDLTFMADHIGKPGLSQLCYQNTESQIVWALRANGELAGMTYNRLYNMIGFFRVVTYEGDEIVAVATKPGDVFDELWIVAKRMIGEAETYCVEVMEDVDLDVSVKEGSFLDSCLVWDGGGRIDIVSVTQASPGLFTLDSWPQSNDGVDMADGDNVKIRGYGVLDDGVFVVANADSSLKTLTLQALDGTAIDTSAFSDSFTGATIEWVENTFTGLSHLASTDVTVLADGIATSGEVEADGSIVLGDYAGYVRIGRCPAAIYKSLPVEIASSQSTLGRPKQLKSLGVVVDNAFGGKYGVDLSNMKDFVYYVDGAPSESPDGFSGSVLVPGVGGSRSKDLFLYITQEGPYPMTICGITPDLEIR